MVAPTCPSDSVLFLIDGTVGGCNSSTILRAVLNSVAKTIQNWLVRDDFRCEVSVVVVNAEISFAGKPNVSKVSKPQEASENSQPVVLMRFDHPSTNDMLRLLWLGAELEDCDADGRHLLDGLIKPTFDRQGLQKGFQSALAQFETLSTESKSHRRLVLITKNQSEPFRSVKFSLLVEHLIHKRVEIIPLLVTQDPVDLPTSLWRGLFDQHFFYNTDLDGDGNSGIRWGTSLVGPKTSISAALQPVLLKPDESDWKNKLLVAVQNAAERKKPSFRAQLVLGDLKIGVSGHRMAEYVSTVSNYAVSRDEDLDEQSFDAVPELSSEETGLVGCTGLDRDEFSNLYGIYANPTDKMIIKAFINKVNIPDYGRLDNAVLITASDFQLAESHRAFNSLHRSMIRSRRIAEIVWYKQCDPRKNLRLPVLGCLFAFDPSEADDYATVCDGGEKLSSASCKTGFVFVPTPTLDELHLYNHNKGKTLDVSLLKPEMRAILKCFWSSQSYAPDLFSHPILQQTARVIEYLGLQLGTKESLAELPAIQDCTVPDYTFLKNYMTSENAIEKYFRKANDITSPNAPDDNNRPLPRYLPVAIEKSLREQDHLLSCDDLEIICATLVGFERWQKWIDRPPQTIRTYMYNYLKLFGLDCLVETVRCPHMIHDLVQFSVSQSRLSDIPMSYKILVCMMYEKPLPETEKELRKILQSIFVKPAKRPRDRNDYSNTQSVQKSARTSKNIPAILQIPLDTPSSTSIPAPIMPQQPLAVQSSPIVQLDLPPNTQPPPVASPQGNEPTPIQTPVTGHAPLAPERLSNHERQPSLSTSMSSLYMTQPPAPVSFLPSAFQNEAPLPSLNSQVVTGGIPSSLESSLLPDQSLVMQNAFPVLGSQIPETLTAHLTVKAETATPPFQQQCLVYPTGHPAGIDSVQNNSTGNLGDLSNQGINGFGASNSTYPPNERIVADSQVEWVRRGSFQPQQSLAPQTQSVVQPARQRSPVPEGPHYIPLPWMRAVAFSTWYTELQPYEHVMLAELFGVDNRNPATVEHHLSAFFRNELNRRKALRINDLTNRTRYASEKTMLFEFLNTTPAPKRLHDYVKEAFWRENNNDGSYMLTGIMLRTVSRMYGLPTNAPMPDIVRRLRKVFGDPIIGNPNNPDSKQGESAELERIESSSDEDDFSFDKESLPAGVSAREYRRTVRQQRTEPVFIAPTDLTGIERLKHIITPQERFSLNRELVAAIDSGDLTPLPAAQLQFICKRLRLRNDGSRTVLIDRIKSDLRI